MHARVSGCEARWTVDPCHSCLQRHRKLFSRNLFVRQAHGDSLKKDHTGSKVPPAFSWRAKLSSHRTEAKLEEKLAEHHATLAQRLDFLEKAGTCFPWYASLMWGGPVSPTQTIWRDGSSFTNKVSPP